MAGPQPRYDWEQIAQEYQQGYVTYDPETSIRKHRFPTHEELSNKYGCSSATMKIKSASDDWSLKRELFRTKIREKLQEKHLSELFSHSSKFDAKNLHKLDQMHSLLDKYMAQFSTILDPENGQPLEDEESPRIIMKDLESMVRLLKESHSLARNILGEPLQSNSLMEELNSINTSNNKSDSKSRKSKIKKLSTKLTVKEKAEQILLQRKKELEEKLKLVEGE